MRLLVLGPTHAFEGREETGFSIVEDVAEFFGISVRSVHSCGSAKLGFSPIKGSNFVISKSDLDLAIIDGHCFNNYLGRVIEATKQYRDLTGFRRLSGGEYTYHSFIKYLAKGMFRPDLMPTCEAKREWFHFFNTISSKHTNVFGKISAGIYLSDHAFQLRQSETIAEFGKKGAHI